MRNHLVPENVFNIIDQFNPNNMLTNQNEKWNAEARLRAIIEECEKGLAVKKVNSK